MELHYKLKRSYRFMIFTVDIPGPFLRNELQTQIWVKTYFQKYCCMYFSYINISLIHYFTFISAFSKRNIALIVLILYSLFLLFYFIALKYTDDAMFIIIESEKIS